MENLRQDYLAELIDMLSLLTPSIVTSLLCGAYLNRAVSSYLHARHPILVEMNNPKRFRPFSPAWRAFAWHFAIPAVALINSIKLEPIRFEFEGSPFALLAIPAAISVPFYFSTKKYDSHKICGGDISMILGPDYGHRWNRLLARHISWETMRNCLWLGSAVPIILTLDRNYSEHPPIDNTSAYEHGIILSAIATYIILFFAIHKIIRFMTPHVSMVHYYIRYKSSLKSTQGHQYSSDYKSSRWRSAHHQSSFEIAREIRYYAAGIRKRLTESDYHKLAITYNLIAARLIESGVRNAAHGPESSESRILTHAAFDLITNTDPMAAVELAKIIVGENSLESNEEATIRSRREMFTSRASELSQRLARPARLLIVLLGLAYLVVSGNIQQVVEIILS